MAAPVKIFKGKYAATITGSITTAESVGPLVFSGIYNGIFLRDGTYEQQDLRGFMLCLALSSAIVNLMGTWFFGWSANQTAHDVNNEATNLVSSTPSAKQQDGSTLANCDRREITPLQMVTNVKFQAMVWSGIILNSLKFYCIYNVNAMVVSFNQEQYELILPYITHTTSIVFKTIMGCVMDKCLKAVPLANYLIFSGVVHILFFVLAIFWIDNIYMLSVAILFWTISGDLAIIVEPLMSLEQFGLSMVAINWGCALAVWTTMSFSIQFIFAKTYAYHADPNTGLCFGRLCFREQLIVNSSLAAFGLFLVAVYIYKTRYHGNKVQKQ